MRQQIINALKQLRNQYEFALNHPYRISIDKFKYCVLCEIARQTGCNICPWTRFYYQASEMGCRPCKVWLNQWNIRIGLDYWPGFFGLRNPAVQSQYTNEVRKRRIQMLNEWIRVYEEEEAR